VARSLPKPIKTFVPVNELSNGNPILPRDLGFHVLGRFTLI
jgi:hypothetical protein